jgi:hypothetical protein
MMNKREPRQCENCHEWKTDVRLRGRYRLCDECFDEALMEAREVLAEQREELNCDDGE